MISLLEMTAGAQRMAGTDPHGWTLSLIAVTTVFTALLILYFIYSIIGKAAQKSVSAAPKSDSSLDAETVAAIAMALEAELGGGSDATVHDIEPGIITITPSRSAWNDKTLTFRKTPGK